MDGGSIPGLADLCFYQIVDSDILSKNDTFVFLKGNMAPITGYEIYAASVEHCISLIPSKEKITTDSTIFSVSRAIFSHVFHLDFLNISLSSLYQVSSQPATVCFCYQGPQLTCDETMIPNISVYPEQTFKILAVRMGVGISPAVVRSRISDKYDIFPELQSLGNACEPLNYIILAPGNLSGIRVWLTVVLF